MINIFISAAVAVAVSVASWFSLPQVSPQQVEQATQDIQQAREELLGADTNLPLAGTVYTLSGSGVSGSATSITLNSFTIPQTGYEILDADLSATFYLTLEPGSKSRQEIVSCTTVSQSGSDTTATLSGCTRGLLPFSPYTASSSYQFAHGGGTAVVLSNPPHLYNQFASTINDEYVTGTWTFAPGTAKYASNPNFTGSSTTLIPDLNYVNTVASSGAPMATDAISGVSRIALQSELITGSSTELDGGNTVYRVPSAQFFNATSTTTSTIPVAHTLEGTLYKISPSFIATSSPYTWSATSTFTGNIIASSSANTFATSTFTNNITINGSCTGCTKFGGNGTDGALSISSGTTTVSLTSSSTKVFNYSSISITGTGRLAFSNPSASGTLVILKSQGDVTITCSSAPCIDLRGIGATSTIHAWVNPYSATSTGINGAQSADTNGAAGGAAGNVLVNQNTFTPIVGTLARKTIVLTPGDGGANGGAGSNGAASGKGGAGGGAILIEVGGALNFTTALGIDISATAGTAGGTATAGQRGGGGGGGGGCAGTGLIVYNTLTAASGTFNASGGASGAGGGGSTDNTSPTGGGGGGGGCSMISTGGAGAAGGATTGNGNAGNNGGTASGSGAGGGGGGGGIAAGSTTGGAGASGGTTAPSLWAILQNTEF